MCTQGNARQMQIIWDILRNLFRELWKKNFFAIPRFLFEELTSLSQALEIFTFELIKRKFFLEAFIMRMEVWYIAQKFAVASYGTWQDGILV